MKFKTGIDEWKMIRGNRDGKGTREEQGRAGQDR